MRKKIYTDILFLFILKMPGKRLKKDWAFLFFLLLITPVFSSLAQNINVSNSDINVPSGTYLTIGGDIILQSSGGIVNNGTTQLGGNWTNNGSGLISSGTGTVEFNGTTAQTIGGTSANAFYGLKINNSSGVTLASNASFNGNLNLSSGIVSTGAYKLSALSGFSVNRTSGYVNGYFSKPFATGSNVFQSFEVGTPSYYTPVSVTMASVTAGGSLTAKSNSGDHPQISSACLNSSKSVNLYYSFANSGITFTTASVTLNYTAGSLDAGIASFRSKYYDGSAWGAVFSNTGTSASITLAGVTQLAGDFQVAELNPDPVATPSAPVSICSGGSTVISVVASGGSGSGYTYLWSSATGLSSTTVSNPTANPASTTTYSVTVTDANNCTSAAGTVTVTVNPNLPASVSIAASPTGSICSGTSVTFTATPTNGGTTPSYQWKVNGVNAGTNSATFNSSTLANADAVTCVMTSNATCATGSPATSNTVTMTVNPNLAASVSIAAVPSGNICPGTSVTFTATPTNGGGTPSYQWKVNGVNAGANSTTFNSSTLVNSDAVSCVMTSNATCATGSPATSNTVTMTVNPNVAASISIAASPSGSICSGTSVTFTATPTNGGATPSYQWKVNGVNSGTNSATFNSSTLVNADAVTCVMTSNATCATGSPATSNTVTMTVNPNLAASVSIVTSPSTTICSGTSVTFTATPINGGAGPTYQWKVNGVNAGTNSTTFNSSTLVNADAVKCVMTSNATCATGSPATSNTVTMTVNPNLPVSVSIAASPSTSICSGTSITFTATPTNGGAGPSYQWKVNGVNVGTNSTTFNSSTLANADAVKCVMTSNATCATGSPATSNTLTMSVTAAGAAGVSIAASPSTTICSGTSVIFTATPTNGGVPTYQWKINGVNTGTNSATFNSTTLANADAVSCVMTSSLVCATGSPATSNTVTMTVNPNLAASVTIAAVPSASICPGTIVTFTATPTNGGGSPSYQWKVNGVNVGTNSTTFNSSTLVDADAVTCVMTSNATCATGSPATSNTITMTVNPNLPASVSIAASPSTSICSGNSVTFTATPTNGGTPTYQWQVNGVNAGTNSATFNSSGLVNADAVTCVMTSNATCVTGSPATSNTLTMSVTAAGAAGVSIAASPSGSICSGTSVTFTANPTNGGAATYQWQVNGVNAGTNSATFISTTLANANAVTCIMTSSLACATGSPVTSNTVNMTVNPNLAAGISIAAVPSGSICPGTSVTFTATPTNGGTPTYQWQVNGVNAGTNSATFNSSALVNADAVTCIMTSNAVCVTGSPDTSNTVTMTVNPNVAASVSIAASPSGSICSGTSVTFTATPVNGGAAPSYQWKVNGVNVGTNSATFNSSTLANTDAVKCVMTSNATCATGSPATSNTVTMTVNPNLAASVSIAASPSGSICPGTSVTFTATPTNGGTPVYQWKVNGVNTGPNSATFISTSLVNADAVTCVMTSNAVCVTGSPATSNTVTMTVNPNVTASVSIAASPSGSICPGTSVTFTATPVNGGGSPAYQWKVNGVNSGANSPTFISSTLSNADVVKCVMTSNAACVTGSPATSNTVTMTVNPNVPASVSILASPAGSICSGTSVTFTATPVNGGAAPSYQWKVNGVNAGANSATFISSTLSNADAVKCVMTSNAVCVTGSPATSNTVTMTVNPNVAADVSIAAVPSGSVCSGTSVTFTATPVNGGGAPSYQWKLNGSDISGATNSAYSSSTLSNSDQITVLMISNAACASPAVVISAPVTMTVNLSPSVTNNPLTTTICSGIAWSGLALTADIAGTTYSWTSSVSGSITGNTASGTGDIPAQTFINNSGAAGAVTYSITPTANGCMGAASNYIVTVNTGIGSTGTITGVSSACTGAAAVSYSIAAVTGAANYNWTVPAGATITAGANTTNITVTFGSTSGDITVTPSNTCGNGTSSILTVTMTGTINSLGGIIGSGAVCASSAGQIYSVAGVAGATGYTWSVPAGANITSGVNSTSITLDFDTASGLISVIPVNACGNGTASTLNVTVNPIPTITSAATGTICSGVNQNYTITSGVPGTTFNWSRDPLSSTTQTNNPITEALFNSTSSALAVRYVIVPVVSGCTGPAFNYDLTVNPFPVVTTAGSTIVCSGSATDISLISNVPGSTIAWATPAITGKITGSSAGSGNNIAQTLMNQGGTGTALYQVQATANGCIGAATDVLVNVVALPVVAANASDTTVCAGTKIILSGSGANNYSWDNGISDSVSFASTITKTYTVTGTDFNGCINTDSITITVNPIPTVDAGSNKTVNEGTSVTLTATGNASSYTWNYGVIDGVSFIPLATNTGYYIVTGQLGNCTAKDSLILNVIRANSPKIVLFYSNNQLINLQQLDIGSKNVNQGPYKYTFTVNNIGSIDLNLSSIFLSASAGDTFSLDQTGTKSVVTPGSLTTFDLIFNPLTIGNKTVKLTIASNDIDAGNFEVDITAASSRLKPVIAFTLIGDKEYGSDTFNLSAMASNGKPVTFTSLTPSIVSVSGSKAALLKIGTAIIKASTAEDSIYEAASSQQNFEVKLPAFGILGPDYVVTSVKNIYQIYPVNAQFKYYWIYKGNNLNGTSDTIASISADNQTTDGIIECLVYDVSGLFLDTVQKPIVVNYGKSNFLALTKTSCTPAIENSDSTYIKDFQFENISVSSTYNNSGITDYTQAGFSTELFLGETYSGKLKIGGGKMSRAVGVWIDFNNSGEFDSDEFVFDGLTSDTVVDILNVRIQNVESFAGFRRMRVRVRENAAFASAQSCVGNGDKGETEDYIVELKSRNDLKALEGMTPNSDGKNDCFVIRGVNPRSVRRSLDVFNISGDLVYTSDFYQNDWCGHEMNSNKLVPRGTYYFVFRTDENTLKSFIEIIY
jgi:hypothetical protein